MPHHSCRRPRSRRETLAAVRRGELGCARADLRRSRPRRSRRVLLAVDAVGDTVDEAIEADADLLLVHHPLLLRGVTSVAEDRYKGALLARLIRADCALLAAHTNADVVADGVSAVLADRLGLVDAAPIVPGADGVTGIGRVGTLAEPDHARAPRPRSSPNCCRPPPAACASRATTTSRSRASPSAGEQATRCCRRMR